MKKTILSIFAALFALTLCFQASANGTTTGTLTSVYGMNASLCSPCNIGTVIAVPSATGTGQPSCATTYHSYAVDSTTAAGKTIAAMLTLALASGRTVTIYGDGTCSVWVDRETIQYVILN